MGLFSFLSNKLPIDTQRIEQAIADLEQKTSAELRVVVERKAKIGKTDNAAILRASELFDELKMRETAERNGVLIYLSFKPHYAAIIGDEGIHQKSIMILAKNLCYYVPRLPKERLHPSHLRCNQNGGSSTRSPFPLSG